MVTRQLEEMAGAIADWAAGAPLTVSIFVFGSRVRGDHGPNDDVDLSIDYGGSSDEIAAWRAHNEKTDYAALRNVLPGQLKLAPFIARGSLVHWNRNVYCLWQAPREQAAP
jgi:predicted nucleotidyltransferase